MSQVEDAIAASLEHFDLGVDAFHKSTGLSVKKVIGDLIHPVVQHGQERLETTQSTVQHLVLPLLDLFCRLGFGQVLLEDRR